MDRTMGALRHLSTRPKAAIALGLTLTAAYLLSNSSEPSSSSPFGHRSDISRVPGEGLREFPLHFLNPEEEEFGDTQGWGVGGWIGHKETKPLLLLTGGAGQLGQALLPRLTESYTVHIIDIAPRPATLPAGVIYHRASILSPSNAFPKLFSEYSWSGIIHLAAISLDAWCDHREAECRTVNEGGVKALAHEVDKLTERRGWKSKDMPWVIYTSSMDVLGPKGKNEVSPRHPESALGRTKAQGEAVLEAMFERTRTGSKGGIHASILRFAGVYGYDDSMAIPQSFVPMLMANAMTSRPIQYDSDAAPLDLTHVDDAVDGVMRAVTRIAEHKSEKRTPKLEIFNLVSGKSWTHVDLVERIMSAVDSKSPMRDIGDAQAVVTDEYSNSWATSMLDWNPSITLREGIHRALKTFTTEMTEYSESYRNEHCQVSTPTAPLVPADRRNRALHKLDQCTVNLGFDHLGMMHHFKCEDGKHCFADGEKVSGYNWNATVFTMRRVGERGSPQDRKAVFAFEQENEMGWLGIYEDEAREYGDIGFELIDRDGPHRPAIFNFEVEVAPDSSMMRITLPDYGSQVHAVANVSAQRTYFSLEKPGHLGGQHFDMRMTVLCCPSEGDWPLVLDDHESSDTRFGQTDQIPFNASRRLSTCTRAEEAYRYNSKRLAEVTSKASDHAPHVLPPSSLHPHEWALRTLPTCWNDCNSPAVCVQTGSCRCVESECPLRRENPLLTLKRDIVYEPGKSALGALAGPSAKLAVSVRHKDLRDVLLPSAKDYLAKHPDFIKIFVADGYDGQEKIETDSCHKLQDRHCFSADNILYRAMRALQVKAHEADLVILPVYQQCKGADFMLHNVTHHAEALVPDILKGTRRTATIMTHDWSICIGFRWEIWTARAELYPDWILDNTLVFAPMGDYDSPCYRPHQDIVIPARSCATLKLLEAFPTINDIRPMIERPHLATWAGTYWGTGKSERLRLTCGRGGAGERELVQGAGKQSVWYDWDYMAALSSSRFCPLPRGIAGWSPRLNDAIWAGCIPVLIAEGTHNPYADFLDWSKFSVRVDATELDHLEQILEGISLEKVEDMQANLALIRDGFLYSSDESPEDELRRKGPMWFALHSAGMRLRTAYPTA